MSPTDLTTIAEQLLTQYGYLALFGIFILEGAMLLYFAPSESLVPGAIFLLTDQTVIEIMSVIMIAVIGATIGQTVLFLLAKRGGREYLLERQWFRISEDRLDRFDRWFDRWGPLSVAASNSLPFTRGMLTVPAGFANMTTSRFILVSMVGTICFESILALLTIGVFELL
jgi:membrane protein DedA with SNARE-associated domain